jgi:hypothetical protein
LILLEAAVLVVVVLLAIVALALAWHGVLAGRAPADAPDPHRHYRKLMGDLGLTLKI